MAQNADTSDALGTRYRALLEQHRAHSEHDPQSNAVKLLAFDISHQRTVRCRITHTKAGAVKDKI